MSGWGNPHIQQLIIAEHLEHMCKNATIEQMELIVEKAVAACPNLFVVARGLRAALQDDWERSEVAELLLEEVGV